MQVEESSVENMCRSPVVFSSKLRPLHGGDLKSGTKGIKCSNIEWVEQYQPGVFITLTLLQDGKSGLKRIRFRFVSILKTLEFELAFSSVTVSTW